MNTVEKENIVEESLISKDELHRLNPLFYHIHDDFLEIDVSTVRRVDAFNKNEYWAVDGVLGGDLWLNANIDSFSNIKDAESTAVTELKDTISNYFDADPSCARLMVKTQVKATEKLNQLQTVVGEVNGEASGFSQAELREYMTHIIGIDGIIRVRAAHYISQKVEYLNGLLSELEDLQPWIVANVHKDAPGPAHIAARLVEFRMHGVLMGMPTLEPVVLTKDNERALLPIYYSIDPVDILLFDDIRRNS